jgi:hypothetical protein
MKLSAPAAREPIHRRDIVLHGYRRTDGLYDIEAVITDTKAAAITLGARRTLPAGEPLHQMMMRLTVDETLLIVAAEAVTEAGPYPACPGGADSFASLAGLRIRPGFMREAMVRLAGVAGCTHIRELVQQLATVAFQTMFSVRTRKSNDEAAGARMVNSCHAYAADGAEVRRRWPQLYTGPDAAAVAAD